MKIRKKIKSYFALRKFKALVQDELETLAFFQEFEKEIIEKPVFAMSKFEYQQYLELISVVKACARKKAKNRKAY